MNTFLDICAAFANAFIYTIIGVLILILLPTILLGVLAISPILVIIGLFVGDKKKA